MKLTFRTDTKTGCGPLMAKDAVDAAAHGLATSVPPSLMTPPQSVFAIVDAFRHLFASF